MPIPLPDSRSVRHILPVVLALATALLIVISSHSASQPTASGAPWWERFPETHDGGRHYEYTRAFVAAFRSGALPPRWDAEASSGWGSPGPGIYPPGVYYVGAALYFLTGGWGVTLVLWHVTLFAASGLALYACARRLMSTPAALMAAAAYQLLPYHVVDLHQRAAMAELLGFVATPIALLGLHELVAIERGRGMRLLAIGFGLALVAHPPTAYPLAWALLLLGGSAHLRAVAASLGLGVSLAAFYFIPLMAEAPFVRVDDFTKQWPFTASGLFAALPPEHSEAFWQLLHHVWFFGLGILIVSAAAVRGRGPARWWLVLGAGTALFSTVPAARLVGWLPGIAYVSFPWRLFALQCAALALLIGYVAEAGRSRPWAAAAAWALVVGALCFDAVWVLDRPPSIDLREGRAPETEWCAVPRGAPIDEAQLPKRSRADTSSGSGRVDVVRWAPQDRAVVVETATADRVRFRTFAFPGWRATVDGTPAPLAIGAFNAIEVPVGPGRHRVDLRLGATGPRIVGATVTALAALILAAWEGYSRRERRKRGEERAALQA